MGSGTTLTRRDHHHHRHCPSNTANNRSPLAAHLRHLHHPALRRGLPPHPLYRPRLPCPLPAPHQPRPRHPPSSLIPITTTPQRRPINPRTPRPPLRLLAIRRLPLRPPPHLDPRIPHPRLPPAPILLPPLPPLLHHHRLLDLPPPPSRQALPRLRRLQPLDPAPARDLFHGRARRQQRKARRSVPHLAKRPARVAGLGPERLA